MVSGLSLMNHLIRKYRLFPGSGNTQTMCGSWREPSSDIPKTATTSGETDTLLGIPTEDVVSGDCDDVIDAELVVSLNIGSVVVESGTVDVVLSEVDVSPELAAVEFVTVTVSAVVLVSDEVVMTVDTGLVVVGLVVD